MVLVALPLRPVSLSAQETPHVRGALLGRVADARTGTAVANAIVSIQPASVQSRTDSSGGFRITGLAVGPVTVIVTAVGYQPARLSLRLTDSRPVELEVELEPFAPILDRVLTTASADAPRNPALNEFEARRATGLGRFLTRDALLADRGRLLDAVLSSRFAGIRVITDNNRSVAVSGRAGGRIESAAPCRLNVIVDGVLRYIEGMELFDLRTLEASMIAGIELYTSATLPAEFNMGSNTPCGALVIWLQH